MLTTISVIAAIGKNRELGKDNELLWPIPEDLKRFKSLTLGHPIIMGRKTFDSIGRPLPNRTNIVVTRDADWKAPSEDVIKANSVYDAVVRAKNIDPVEIFIIGGAQIYEEGVKFATRLYLTLVDAEAGADTFFPPYEDLFTKKIFEETHDWNGLRYTWLDLERGDK
jgi:dihydrofolate reductase